MAPIFPCRGPGGPGVLSSEQAGWPDDIHGRRRRNSLTVVSALNCAIPLDVPELLVSTMEAQKGLPPHADMGPSH